MSCLQDRPAVGNGAEIGLLSLLGSAFPKGESLKDFLVTAVCPIEKVNSMGGPPLLGDFLLTAVCPIEKVTQWEGLLYWETFWLQLCAP